MIFSTSTVTQSIGAAVLVVAALTSTASLAADDGLPDPGFDIVPGQTALVITDPQNDFLSPKGVAWGVVGANVEANGTVGHIDDLFAAAKAVDMPVFVSPHYYFPHDHGWKIDSLSLSSTPHPLSSKLNLMNSLLQFLDLIPFF